MTQEPLIWSTLLILSLCVARSNGPLTRWDVATVLVVSGSVLAVLIVGLVALHHGCRLEPVLTGWFD